MENSILRFFFLFRAKQQDEIETHSKPESVSIFVHYGGDRTNDPKVLSEPDVVLTTYGVLTAAYKNVRNDSCLVCFNNLFDITYFDLVLLVSCA